MANIVLKNQLSEEERAQLAQYNDVESHLLFHRGIKTPEEAERFLNPNYMTHTYSASGFKDMDKAVTRILDAVFKNEKICIYSDYDADGIPGAVILSDFFEKINYENFFIYIPHRNREGFGLHISALDKIHEDGAKLIITIDCGSANIKEVDHANSLGMDVIITDHHEVDTEVPNAHAVINPKQTECLYEEKMLCGSGVIFKVVSQLVQKGNFEIVNGWERWLLDMVGIATISDMVPLVGENRVLARYGLHVLKKTRRPGLLKIFSLKRINSMHLSEDDVSFLITPKINAASRMGEPILAFNLLKAKTESEADQYAQELMRINDKRKVEVARIVKEIKKHLKDVAHEREVIAYGNPDWQPSLMGLVASKIAEEYMKPVFLWGRGDGEELKGSCRGFGTVSVFDLLQKLGDDFFIQYGGHQAAGGFIIKPETVGFLEQALSDHVAKVEQEKTHTCDLEIDIDNINSQLVESIMKLAPYGTGNTKPLFVLNGIVSAVKHFGAHQDHFEISFIQKSGKTIRAIAFYRTEDSFDKKVAAGETCRIIGHIEKSYFAGRTQLQIKLVDIV